MKEQGSPKWLWVLLILISFIAFIIFFSGDCSNEKKTTKESTTTVVQPEETQQTSNVKIGKTKTLYRFADYPNGTVVIPVTSDAEFYPKGGKIKYKTSTGEVKSDEPGTNHVNEAKPVGEFSFWANDSSAWGIEIWQ